MLWFCLIEYAFHMFPDPCRDFNYQSLHHNEGNALSFQVFLSFLVYLRRVNDWSFSVNTMREAIYVLWKCSFYNWFGNNIRSCFVKHYCADALNSQGTTFIRIMNDCNPFDHTMNIRILYMNQFGVTWTPIIWISITYLHQYYFQTKAGHLLKKFCIQ